MPAEMTGHDTEELVVDLPSGLKLAAKGWGPPEGPKVLALHGWLDNAASFDTLAPLLPGIRLVALDLAGHGLSQHRHPTAGYEFVEWVPDVLWAATALGWDRFAILGHSLGAGIAPLVAAAAPDRLDRLVLLDGLGPPSPPTSADLPRSRGRGGAPGRGQSGPFAPGGSSAGGARHPRCR